MLWNDIWLLLLRPDAEKTVSFHLSSLHLSGD